MNYYKSYTGHRRVIVKQIAISLKYNWKHMLNRSVTGVE